MDRTIFSPIIIIVQKYVDKIVDFLYKSPFRRLSVGGTNSNESVPTLYAVL